MKLFLLIVFTSITQLVLSQVDSLYNVYNNAQEDTTKIEALTNIGLVYFDQRNVDSCLYYFDWVETYTTSSLKQKNTEEVRKTLKDQLSYALYNQALVFRNTNQPKRYLNKLKQSMTIMESDNISSKGLARIYYDLNEAYDRLGMEDSSMFYLRKSLKINEELENYSAQVSIHNNIGDIYFFEANMLKATEEYQLALDIALKNQLEEMLSTTYSRIGRVFTDQKQTEKALEYYRKSAVLEEKNNAIQSLSYTFLDIARLYKYDIKNIDSALYYLNEAISLQESIDDKMGLSASYNAIAEILKDQNKIDSALTVLELSYIFGTESGYLNGITSSLNQQGHVFLKTEQYDKAYSRFKEALENLSNSYNNRLKKGIYKGLYKSSVQLNKNSEALEYLENYVKINDSLYNEETNKASLKLQMEHEYQLKKITDSISFEQQEQEKQLAHEQEIETQRTYTYYGVLGCGILFVLFLGIYMNNKQRKRNNIKLKEKNDVISKQKKEVEEQKNILEERNKEIVDSISYAKRLQNAILPPKRIVKEYLPESFIVYLPKDIVAGDFYWMETVDDLVYFAAADCTGHGVPGAMVSVICSNALTKSVIEDKIYDPGKILDRTRELVIQRFVRGEEEVKDGMDISLCCLNTKTNELTWAGANNPLWILRKEGEEIEEIKADKQPIGLYEFNAPFTTHNVQMSKGDQLFIFSDGFADQFGGEKGKKFKSGNFMKLLIQLKDKNADVKRDTIVKVFEDWKGSIEQIDDICVIGLKI